MNEPLAPNPPMTTIKNYERIRNGEARRCFGPRAVHQWLRRHAGRDAVTLDGKFHDFFKHPEQARRFVERANEELTRDG
jgi:hypothetical protein